MLLYRGEFEREVTDLEISGAGTGLIFRRLYRSSAAWNIAGLPNRPSPQRVDSVSSVTINWGDKSFTDSWDVRSAADAGVKIQLVLRRS